MSIKK
jgi:hypothetical protein